jgi:hypothetical protein
MMAPIKFVRAKKSDIPCNGLPLCWSTQLSDNYSNCTTKKGVVGWLFYIQIFNNISDNHLRPAGECGGSSWWGVG